MKYVQQVFDRLSRGGFISSDSVDESTRNIFLDIEDHQDDYSEYFEQIGFILEEGTGFFYFSRRESKTALVDKLKRFGHWIDILDFLKAWEPALGPGFTFIHADLMINIILLRFLIFLIECYKFNHIFKISVCRGNLIPLSHIVKLLYKPLARKLFHETVAYLIVFHLVFIERFCLLAQFDV